MDARKPSAPAFAKRAPETPATPRASARRQTYRTPQGLQINPGPYVRGMIETTLLRKPDLRGNPGIAAERLWLSRTPSRKKCSVFLAAEGFLGRHG